MRGSWSALRGCGRWHCRTRAVAAPASLGVVADVPVLDAAEQRVLGSMLEKEITVPASYPMSINSDRTEVEACLARMASGETAMVRELPRQPGQQDNRWIHLLGPVQAAEATAG